MQAVFAQHMIVQNQPMGEAGEKAHSNYSAQLVHPKILLTNKQLEDAVVQHSST